MLGWRISKDSLKLEHYTRIVKLIEKVVLKPENVGVTRDPPFNERGLRSQLLVSLEGLKDKLDVSVYKNCAVL